MELIRVLTYERWYPFRIWGLTTPLWAIHQETAISSWVTLALLGLLTFFVRTAIRKPNSLAGHAVLSIARGFIGITEQSLGAFYPTHAAFLSTLFLFILTGNLITTFIPWLEEPTSDINTTIALGLCSFIYVQAATIAVHGWAGYLKELATPFFLLPLHITGKIATIISISFRLFGNIFGGAIITQIWSKTVMGSLLGESLKLISGITLIVQLFFGLFEGFIQAFVFFMLSLTYLALGLAPMEHTESATDAH
jgi:F-type H+-transporting ATPase subunit a